MNISEAVSKRDEYGNITESLLHSVELIEESSIGALQGNASSNKERFIAIVAGPSGVHIKKGRKDTSYRVGRTWKLGELTGLESVGRHGLVATIGKAYFWRFKNSTDKRHFCSTVNSIYVKDFHKKIPNISGFDDKIWEGTFDPPRRVSQGQPPPQHQGQHQPAAQQRTPKLSSLETWSSPDMANDSRYGRGRQSNLDLSRKQSRGPNSPASPQLPQSPELSQFPDMGPKQRYKPASSQTSLRTRQQHAFQQQSQASPQGVRPSQSQASLVSNSGGQPRPPNGRPYPPSPVVGTPPHMPPVPQHTSRHTSRDGQGMHTQQPLMPHQGPQHVQQKDSRDSLRSQMSGPDGRKNPQYPPPKTVQAPVPRAPSNPALTQDGPSRSNRGSVAEQPSPARNSRSSVPDVVQQILDSPPKPINPQGAGKGMNSAHASREYSPKPDLSYQDVQQPKQHQRSLSNRSGQEFGSPVRPPDLADRNTPEFHPVVQQELQKSVSTTPSQTPAPVAPLRTSRSEVSPAPVAIPPVQSQPVQPQPSQSQPAQSQQHQPQQPQTAPQIAHQPVQRSSHPGVPPAIISSSPSKAALSDSQTMPPPQARDFGHQSPFPILEPEDQSGNQREVSPAASRRSRQQSDGSIDSFKSARNSMFMSHNRNGSIHQNIAPMGELGPAPHLEQPFNQAAAAGSMSHKRNPSMQSLENQLAEEYRAEGKEVNFSPESTPRLKKLNRMSPARLEVRSPRKSKQFARAHSRQTSNVSVTSVGSTVTDEEAYRDLNAVLSQLGFSGVESTNDLEKRITDEISRINYSSVDKLVSLDHSLDELDRLLEGSIEECESLTNTFGSLAVQLSTIGTQIERIEGKSEGSQVLDMNKRMLLSELEKLLGTVRLPKNVSNVLMRTSFTKEELPVVEEKLVELYKAVDVLNSGTTTMSVAQEQSAEISSLSDSFNHEFAAYFKKQLSNTMSSSEASHSLGRIDIAILRQLYPYAALVLFVKETNTQVFKKITDFYEDNLKIYYRDTLPPYTITWKRTLDANTGGRPKFSFKTGKPPKKIVDESSASALKRGMSVKALKQHENKYQHKALPTKGLDMTKIATINSQFEDFISTITQQIVAQQQVLVNLFHMNSNVARKYDVYIQRSPLKSRLDPNAFQGSPQLIDGDSSRRSAQVLAKFMGRIFASAEDQNRMISETVANSCILESVYLIGLLEKKTAEYSTTDQEYAQQFLNRLRDMLVPQWRKFVDDQSRSILESHMNMSKRVGIMPIAESFVAFVTTVEASMNSLGGGAPRTRVLVDESHKQIFRAITQIFDRSSRSMHGSGPTSSALTTMRGGTDEDKEQLNYHVTMIENLHVITQGLSNCEGAEAIESVIVESRTHYRKEMEAYIADIEQRPLGRLLEFVAKPGGPQPKFKLSTFKKVASSYDSKELRKNVDVLRKRVQKHFGEETADTILLHKVWGAISAEFESKFGKIIALAKQNDCEGVLPLTKQEVREIMQSYA